MGNVLLHHVSVYVLGREFERARVGRDVRCDREFDRAAAESQERVKRRGCGQPVSCVLSRATVLVPPKDFRREPGHGTTVPPRSCVRIANR